MVPFQVDPSRPEPIYRQIIRQVRDAVLSGRLRFGERLPSYREVAASLVINHLTVMKAYEALEREGIIETRRGLGSFVGGGSGRVRRSREREMEDQLREAVRAAADLGYEPESVHALVDEAWPARKGEGKG